MAIDYTSALGQVRLMIPDLDESDFLFTDEQITAFLTMEDDVVDLAVARACEVIAGDHLLLFKANVRADDGTVTASEQSKLLQQRAATLRANASADSIGFAIVGGEEYMYGPEDNRLD